MSLRVVSMEAKSMVYHRAECRYAKKIYKRNKMKMSKKEAEAHGYRSCKCCDSMNYFYQLGKQEIIDYAKDKNMNVDYKDGKIYVRTDAGCWKIFYIKSIQKHDTYKPIMLSDYRQLPRDTKEQKKYYNAAKRRDKRRSAKRLDMLFAVIESQQGMKQLSYC